MQDTFHEYSDVRAAYKDASTTHKTHPPARINTHAHIHIYVHANTRNTMHVD